MFRFRNKHKTSGSWTTPFFDFWCNRFDRSVQRFLKLFNVSLKIKIIRISTQKKTYMVLWHNPWLDMKGTFVGTTQWLLERSRVLGVGDKWDGEALTYMVCFKLLISRFSSPQKDILCLLHRQLCFPFNFKHHKSIVKFELWVNFILKMLC